MLWRALQFDFLQCYGAVYRVKNLKTQQHSIIMLHFNGEKQCLERYVDGKLNGTSTWFNSDGLRIRCAEYEDGVENGMCTRYRGIDVDEDPYLYAEYNNGLLHGCYWEYFEEAPYTEHRRLDRQYDNGIQCGTEHEYNKSRQIIRKVDYVNGKKHGIEEFFYPDSKKEWVHGEEKTERNEQIGGQPWRVTYIGDKKVRADSANGCYCEYNGDQKHGVERSPGMTRHYVDGKLDGVEEDDTKKYHQEYKNGQLHGTCWSKAQYNEDSCEYQNGKKHGKEINRHSGGGVKTIEWFEDKKHGRESYEGPMGNYGGPILLHYECFWKHGKKNGREYTYSPNMSHRKETKEWKEDLLHGKHIITENDVVIYECEYRENKKHGCEFKKNEFRHSYFEDLLTGTCVEYAPDGAPLRECEYIGGQRHGIERQYNNGKLIRETQYAHGFRNGYDKKYSQEGKLEFEISYVNDMKDGAAVIYVPNIDEKLLIASTYVPQGPRKKPAAGKCRVLTSEGKLLQTFKEDVLHGEVIEWFVDGTKFLHEHYVNGVKHGRQQRWDRNGVKTLDCVFENGNQV